MEDHDYYPPLIHHDADVSYSLLIAIQSYCAQHSAIAFPAVQLPFPPPVPSLTRQDPLQSMSLTNYLY